MRFTSFVAGAAVLVGVNAQGASDVPAIASDPVSAGPPIASDPVSAVPPIASDGDLDRRPPRSSRTWGPRPSYTRSHHHSVTVTHAPTYTHHSYRKLIGPPGMPAS